MSRPESSMLILLYITLAASAFFIVVENLNARFKPKSIGLPSAVGFAVTCCLFCSFLSPLPLLANTAVLAVLGVVWRMIGGTNKKLFLGLTLLGTLAAYAAFIPVYLLHQNEVSRLRQKYAFESMDGRAVTPPDTAGAPVPYVPSAAGWLEGEVEGQTESPFSRNLGLADLHEKNLELFVGSLGFGIGRMSYLTDPLRNLDRGLREQPAPFQPVPLSHGTQEAAATEAAPAVFDAMWAAHKHGVLDFVNPEGFGYVKDRQHVAGFQSHGFRELPKAAGQDWEIARLELVSLLKHAEPGVYLSDRLPQMDALDGVPTRPLDAFETDGLARLRKGEELIVTGNRMLGSVRNVKQCIACHCGERGQLLGAFSYSIRPTQK